MVKLDKNNRVVILGKTFDVKLTSSDVDCSICPLRTVDCGCSEVLDILFGDERYECEDDYCYSLTEVIDETPVVKVEYRGQEYVITEEKSTVENNVECNDCLVRKVANTQDSSCTYLLNSLFGEKRGVCDSQSHQYVCTPVENGEPIKLIKEISDLDRMVSNFGLRLAVNVDEDIIYVLDKGKIAMEVHYSHCELLISLGFKFKLDKDSLGSLMNEWRAISGEYTDERNNLVHFDEAHGWMVVEVDRKDSFLTTEEAESLVERFNNL